MTHLLCPRHGMSSELPSLIDYPLTVMSKSMLMKAWDASWSWRSKGRCQDLKLIRFWDCLPTRDFKDRDDPKGHFLSYLELIDSRLFGLFRFKEIRRNDGSNRTPRFFWTTSSRKKRSFFVSKLKTTLIMSIGHLDFSFLSWFIPWFLSNCSLEWFQWRILSSSVTEKTLEKRKWMNQALLGSFSWCPSLTSPVLGCDAMIGD
jgi:hypothetical protein